MVQESNEKIISSYLLSHNNDIYIKNKIKNKNLSTFSLLFFITFKHLMFGYGKFERKWKKIKKKIKEKKNNF